ncbi:MAG: hypothetical protein ACQCN5_13425 [Candidatus Bathyarchaeia archaeon]|jgi:predicted transcriptional regulator
MQPTKPSKLELYLEILRAIETKKPTKLESIKKRTNLDENFVNHAVSFLEKQHLVEKRASKDQAPSFRSTLRGERLSRYFMELSQGSFFCVLPPDATYQSERYPQ